MPGLFDAFNNSVSGINAHRIRMEVVGNNIANASNKNYTRQEARLVSNSSIYDGHNFLGQGVNVQDVIRIRDELLDGQIRNSESLASYQAIQSKWLDKVQTLYNEPSINGINNALTQFWDSWTQLSNDPESFATRANVITKASTLASSIQALDTKLKSFRDDTNQDLNTTIKSINSLSEEISKLNTDIFNIEAGRQNQANDLRDQRDAALNTLASKVDIEYRADSNGMINVFIGDHPLVFQQSNENLVLAKDPYDNSIQRVEWEYGEVLRDAKGGELKGILQVRDILIPEYISQLDEFANNLRTEVNKIYANGVGSDGLTTITSRLGYKSLGVSSESVDLNLVPEGEFASIHISFYDSNNKLTHMAGIIVSEDDTLEDIQQKLLDIPELNASVISDIDNDGRLSLALDPGSTSASFTVSNNTGGYDTSGFISLFGFSQTGKTNNINSGDITLSTNPTLLSANTNTINLATTLGVLPADIPITELGLNGTFTLNLFEGVTQSDRNDSTDPTDWTSTEKSGFNIQQLAVNVDSSDTMETIRDKINNLTADYNITDYTLTASITGNATVGWQFSITTDAVTDSSGDLSTTGSFKVQLGFSNTYEGPTVTNDLPPTNYTGFGDDTSLLATMQFNTFFQGSGASDIALDQDITNPSQIHAGTKLLAGNNALALLMTNLQHERITGNNAFTLNEEYENIVAGVGNDVSQTTRLSTNETLMLEGFIKERDSISGVNLDEELANMILFQRAYEANARMFSTLNEMAQEILRL